MCYNIQLTKTEDKIAFKYRLKQIDLDFAPADYINGFTFPKTPVITNESPNILQLFNWGLIPNWAKNIDIRKVNLNARIETLTEKPSFKNVLNNRCLIIADGFFEWQWQDSKGKSKQKYLVSLPDKTLFAFAGLYSNWNKNEENIESYTIVTTAANKLMSEIHNTKKRMPIILNDNNYKHWLNGGEIKDFEKVDLALAAEKIDDKSSKQLRLF